MKKIMEVLRGARWFEILLAAVAVAVLILLQMRDAAPSGGNTELEKRLCAVLGRIEGVGRVEVMVTEDGQNRPDGVLVVAEGASDMAVCLRLQYAVQTLLGTEVSRIEIVPYGD